MLCFVFMLVYSVLKCCRSVPDSISHCNRIHERVCVKEKWFVLVCSPVVAWLTCFQACDLAVLCGRERAALESCRD